jgi:hypothetical protein
MQMFWCSMWRCNDCISVRISIIFLAGGELIRFSVGTALPDARGTVEVGVWINVTTLRAWASSLCYKTGIKCFVGSNWGVEWRDRCQWQGILLYIGWCDCFIPWFNENLAQFLLGKRANRARIPKQQNLFFPEILKWSKDRFIIFFFLVFSTSKTNIVRNLFRNFVKLSKLMTTCALQAMWPWHGFIALKFHVCFFNEY